MTHKSPADPIVVQVADEQVHDHGADTDLLWSESHYLDVVSPDAGTGAYVRLGRLPNQARSHLMVAIVRPGTGPVILTVPDASLPAVRGAALEVSAAGYALRLALEAPVERLRVTARGAAAKATVVGSRNKRTRSRQSASMSAAQLPSSGRGQWARAPSLSTSRTSCALDDHCR